MKELPAAPNGAAGSGSSEGADGRPVRTNLYGAGGRPVRTNLYGVCGRPVRTNLYGVCGQPVWTNVYVAPSSTIAFGTVVPAWQPFAAPFAVAPPAVTASPEASAR
ncbi:hypothetical protein SSPIM334S_01012 [Streptomyces spiroverticillatus]